MEFRPPAGLFRFPGPVSAAGAGDEHHHSGIAYLTPAQVHYGRAQEILDARHRVITAAASQHPERFVRGLPKRIEASSAVWINPPAGPQPLRHGQCPPPETTTIDTSVSH